jgi:hypothetical protein
LFRGGSIFREELPSEVDPMPRGDGRFGVPLVVFRGGGGGGNSGGGGFERAVAAVLEDTEDLRVLLEDTEDLRTIPMFSQLIGSDSMGVVNG